MSPAQSAGITGVGVVLLGVSDLAPSIEFYRDRLGLPMQFAFEGFAFFDGGGVRLGLSLALHKARTPAAGAVEVVFAVPDVAVAFSALQARGIEFLRAPRQVTPTDWAANFQDPDGHLLSVFGPPGNLAAD